jgi:hypothetical protein
VRLYAPLLRLILGLVVSGQVEDTREIVIARDDRPGVPAPRDLDAHVPVGVFLRSDDIGVELKGVRRS